MFLLKSYNVVWILFFFSIVLAWRRAIAIPHMLLPALILANVGSVFAASFLYPHCWWGNFPGDMPRLLMFNTPLLVYFISQQAHSAKIISVIDDEQTGACPAGDNTGGSDILEKQAGHSRRLCAQGRAVAAHYAAIPVEGTACGKDVK